MGVTSAGCDPAACPVPARAARHRPAAPYRHRYDIASLVGRFENGLLAPQDWCHCTRLTVTYWYLLHLDEAVAAERMITGLRRYTRRHALKIAVRDGYHETLTLFWLAIARTFRSQHGDEDDLTQLNRFVSHYGQREMAFLEFYSRERISSWTARYRWVEPDLKPLSAV